MKNPFGSKGMHPIAYCKKGDHLIIVTTRQGMYAAHAIKQHEKLVKSLQGMVDWFGGMVDDVAVSKDCRRVVEQAQALLAEEAK